MQMVNQCHVLEARGLGGVVHSRGTEASSPILRAPSLPPAYRVVLIDEDCWP